MIKTAPRNRKFKRGSHELQVYDSTKICARITGVPLGLLRSSKRKGCPAFAHGRVDFKEFIVWFFSGGNTDDSTDWTSFDKQQAGLIKEHRLSVLRGESIRFAEVETFLSDIVANTFFSELERLAREFPSQLKGKTEVQINQECVKQIESVKTTLAKKFDAFARRAKKGNTDDGSDDE